MLSDGQTIVISSSTHRLRCNVLLHQPWGEIRMEDMACMAIDHRQLCYLVRNKHTIGSPSETGTIRCPYVLPEQR